MSMETTPISIAALAFFASLSERFLERLEAFQALSAESKRLLALLSAAFLALLVAVIEAQATGREPNELLYVIFTALAQQIQHALTRQKEG
ncbi:MAG: hypothetical protein ACK4JD_12605 [Thermoflexales bacterium]